MRRLTPSQIKSMLRQQEAKQRQAINKFNQAIRDYDRKVKGAIDKYNQEVRSYNSKVRAHNSKVRAHRQRIHQELRRLASSSGSRGTVRIRQSTTALHQSFVRVDQRYTTISPNAAQARFFDLAEQETANSLTVLGALEGATPEGDEQVAALQSTKITSELSTISTDLDQRWRGALYALNPANPDAARHFCASAREVFTSFLALHAPDNEVLSAIPNCDTHNGRPTRRARIQLLISRAGFDDEEFEQFVSDDVENVIDLFDVFNKGTHGVAGSYPIYELASVKHRVEDSILFLVSLVNTPGLN